MSELVTISLKMPSELRDRLKDRATGEGATTSALVLRAVQVMLEGDGDAKVHEPDPRVAELETALAGQKALTAKWQKAAQAVSLLLWPTSSAATHQVRSTSRN